MNAQLTKPWFILPLPCQSVWLILSLSVKVKSANKFLISLKNSITLFRNRFWKVSNFEYDYERR